MNKSFVVYVFDEADRDILMNHGYTLWKEDIENKTFILLRNDTANFSLDNIDHYETDVMPF